MNTTDYCPASSYHHHSLLVFVLINLSCFLAAVVYHLFVALSRTQRKLDKVVGDMQMWSDEAIQWRRENALNVAFFGSGSSENYSAQLAFGRSVSRVTTMVTQLAQ